MSVRPARVGTPADVLVVGLGNPGGEYEGTRHNIGVDVVELLASRYGGRLKLSKERALACEVRIPARGARVALAFPQTFMNLSGESVRLLTRRHGIEDFQRLVVIHDELDLPIGRVKLKMGGGTAGHNGLKSIQAHLHSPDFGRVRIGVGRPPGSQQGADYVLRRPGRAERTELDVAVHEAADAVEAIVAVGFERAMNAVNTAKSATLAESTIEPATDVTKLASPAGARSPVAAPAEEPESRTRTSDANASQGADERRML